MSNGAQISGTAVANLVAITASTLKTGIVALTLRAESINPLEAQAIAVDGKTVIARNGLVFRTAPVLLAIVPVFVVTEVLTGLRLTEGKAEFLAQVAMIIGSFSIFVHGKAILTDGMAGREFGEILGIALVQGDNSVPMVDTFDGIVDMPDIILRVMASRRFSAPRYPLSP